MTIPDKKDLIAFTYNTFKHTFQGDFFLGIQTGEIRDNSGTYKGTIQCTYNAPYLLLMVPEATINTIGKGIYKYDIKQNVSGIKTRLIYGSFEIQEGTTQT